MRFETDVAQLREEPMRLKSLKERLDQIHTTVERLREFRRDLNDAEPLSLEEFLRTERHIHTITDENKARFQEQHRQHVQVQERKAQEAQSRLENARQHLRDDLHDAEGKLNLELERAQKLERTLRALQETLQSAQLRVEVGAKQLTLEQINQLTQDLERHDWLKRTI